MEVGVDVWLKDHRGNNAWIEALVSSKVQTNSGIEISVTTSYDGQLFSFKIKEEGEELDDVKLRNSPGESNVENLIKLPYLHEPAILYCLQQRYDNSDIYTFTGPILIAVNPFKKVNLYSSQTLETYYNFGLLKSQGIDSLTALPPHIYSIADAAYRDMMTMIHGGYGGSSSSSSGAGAGAPKLKSANQSILISGESGAGKTESTKIVLKYLTTVGSSTGSIDTLTGSVMDKVLQSNPILEAFGNARTIRNDNSSRFGKFIELNFNRRGHLIGGTIKTYLLEKVRLSTQQPGERNYHIFYQMAIGGSPEQKLNWHINTIDEFWYTNQGSIYELRHVNDKDEFISLLQALKTLNFGEEDQKSLFRILAGLLHFGQLQFIHDHDGEGSEVAKTEDVLESLQYASELCGIDSNDLIRTLTIRRLVTREETVDKKHTPSQASDARDALAKAIYGRIFDWIVAKINECIQIDASQVRADIGVLDIFGFECFQHNSFEQLCINYTNETLQQQFNQFVFKMEQIEYQKEKIEWSFIEFPDNQDCLDLIEHKQHGILAMLDDECRLPRATDEKLASRLYKSLDSHSRFTANVVQKRDAMFCIKHYAGQVLYSAISFIEKNKDELPKEAALLLQSSSISLLSSIFSTVNLAGASAQQAQAALKKRISVASISNPPPPASVSTQFKEQLHNLMTKVYATTPHYIRCLKPNDENVPDYFNRLRTTEQLRYGGVLEVVRVARSGFPVRLSHSDFYARYRSLANPFNSLTSTLPSVIPKDEINPKLFCEQLLLTLWDETTREDVADITDDIDASLAQRDSIGRNGKRQSLVRDLEDWKGKSSNASVEWVQLGLSKVFLRKQAHDLLESRRSKRLFSAAKKMQSVFRCYAIKKAYIIIKLSVRLLQKVVRGHFARNRVYFMRRLSSCIKLQRCYRRYICERKFLLFRFAVILLQSGFRSRKARAFTDSVRYNNSALRLSRIFRGIFRRFKYQQMRSRVILLQCVYRRKLARRILKERKIAAKDIGRLQQSNDALKAEIEMLRSKAAEESKRIQEQMLQQAAAQAAIARKQEVEMLKLECDELKKRVSEEIRLRSEAEKKLQASEEQIKKLEQQTARAQSQSYAKPSSVVSLAGVFDSEVGSPSDHGSSSSSPQLLRTLSGDDSQKHHPTSIGRLGKNLRKGSETSEVYSSVSVDLVHAESYERELRQLRDALSSEKAGKDILEEEVTRLRRISIELNAQIDGLRRSSAAGAGSSSTSSVVALARQRSSIGRQSLLGHANNGVNGHLASSDFTDRSSESSFSMKSRKGSLRKEFLEQSAAQSGKQWDEDDEDDSSEVRSQESDVRSQSSDNIAVVRRLSSTIRSQVQGPSTPHPMGKTSAVDISSTHEGVLGKFEKNLENWKHKLINGIRGFVWEGQRIAKIEGILKLDTHQHSLNFDLVGARRGFTSLFVTTTMNPIMLSEIFECLPGAEIQSEAADEARFITIVSSSGGEAPRIVAFKVDSKEERNSLVTGLRSIVSEIQSPRDQNQSASRKTESPTDGLLSTTTVRTSRRLSVRDIVLEETTQASTGSAIGASSNGVTTTTRRLSTSATSLLKDSDVTTLASLEEMRRLLIVERTNKERLYMQNLTLTNDLNERDEQIFTLKKRDSELSQAIAVKDKMYEQDALVRMQLGKRLEQILMDKEEILEQYDMLKDQCETLRASVALIQTGGPSGPK